jgi:uncharacterized protein YkwD
MNGPRERPNRMRAFGVVLAAVATPIAVPTTAAQQTPTAEATYGTRVIALENAARAHAGCLPLRADPAITKAAAEHARDMGTKDYLGHDSQATAAGSPWDRMKSAGYGAPAAENIAAGYVTPEDVVSGWMDDAGHKANILNCSVKATGVGYFHGDKPGAGPWWTQDFGYR